jgi:hypothetical protein
MKQTFDVCTWLFVAGIMGRTVGWSFPNHGSCQQSDL